MPHASSHHSIFIWLLRAGALFFFFEFVLHLFGLAIIEHDKIFLFTHDRYIALYALTYGFLLTYSSINIERHRKLCIATLVGLALAFINAYTISLQGGYDVLFPTISLDENLTALGTFFLIWYLTVLYCAYKCYRHPCRRNGTLEHQRDDE